MAVTRPKTDPVSAVLQFHLRLLNWYLHSSMPNLAPSPMGPMWSWYSWHNFCWPEERPGSSAHRGCVPRMKSSGLLRVSNWCILESKPKFLKLQRKWNLLEQKIIRNQHLMIRSTNASWKSSMRVQTSSFQSQNSLKREFWNGCTCKFTSIYKVSLSFTPCNFKDYYSW